MREETKCITYSNTKSQNQVSDFLHCCLKMLGDPIATKKLTHMLTRCMKEGEIIMVVFSPLPKQDVCHVSKRKRKGRELKMTSNIGSYKMYGVMLDLGSNVDIFQKKSWELMGKPKLVWSPIQLRLANQYKTYPIDRIEKVEVNIDGVKTK